MRIARQTCLAIALGLLLTSVAQGQSEQLVRDFIRQEYGTPAPNTVRRALGPEDDDYVSRTFPGIEFYGVQFRQWPVAFLPPGGLPPSLVAVVFDGEVFLLLDPSHLRDVFLFLPPAEAEAQAIDAGRTYLRLTQEFIQDEFYRFTEPDVGTFIDKDGTLYVFGEVHAIRPTGTGRIAALLIYLADGTFYDVFQEDNVVAGIRPICQSTKLLDPDPIVRKMAEQTILAMGRKAKDYLDEQRAKASPELKEAIDRIWKRIVDEGW